MFAFQESELLMYDVTTSPRFANVSTWRLVAIFSFCFVLCRALGTLCRSGLRSHLLPLKKTKQSQIEPKKKVNTQRSVQEERTSQDLEIKRELEVRHKLELKL